ncbi:MAG: sulfatase-like hydrolase/transferase [Candidatus Sumerlaeota bacterium]|nr:sulfatase-like hydrolase/transferase [Candidatus Sumerlaeota bacterium]
MPQTSAHSHRLTRRQLLARLGAGAAALAWPASRAAWSQAPKRPNVLVILADDLGWGDISLHDGKTPTPNIDGFFQSSLELACFTVQPVCSPTRSCLLTGRNCIRTGVTPNTINADTGETLAAGELTLGEAFEANGYETAILGKWHLGFHPTPNEQGFDLAYGNFGAAVDYFTRMTNRGYYDWELNQKPLVEEGYNTDLIRNHAVQYLQSHGGEKPFFLYVPFTAVHAPTQASEEYLKRVSPDIQDEEQRVYSAMIIALDDAVGAILKALEEKGLADDTIVFFGSDNGAPPIGNNLPYRGGKHTLWEGGLRTPAAIRWPNHLPARKRTAEFLSVDDLHSTLLALAGAKRPDGPPLDGFDVSAVLREGAPSPRQFRCWIWNNYDAIRTAQYKLLRWRDHKELYDLQADPSETKNVLDEQPDAARKLEDQMNAWMASVPCHPSHVPVRLDPMPRPAPEGDALEVRIHRKAGGKGEPLTFFLGVAAEAFQMHPGDVLQYDMLVAEGSTEGGFLIDVARGTPSPYPEGFFPGFFPPGVEPTTKPAAASDEDQKEESEGAEGATPPPAKGAKAGQKKAGAKAAGAGAKGKKKATSSFTPCQAVDQYGTLQGGAAGFPQANGKWATRLIGLANMCPAMISAARLVVTGEAEARYLFYLDNIVVRRHDGSTVDLYRNGPPRDLTAKKLAAYPEVSVKAVPVSQCKTKLE